MEILRQSGRVLYQKAIAAPLNLTAAAQNLELLERMRKSMRPAASRPALLSDEAASSIQQVGPAAEQKEQ